MNEQPVSTISFSIEKDHLSLFFSLLQQGFIISAEVGCSLKNLICNQFNVTPEYLSGRISTIFLNGKPVDDVKYAIIKDGDILALSGAMPGLVGATFRSGGALSVFRSSITHENDDDINEGPVQGRITLKLFNLLVSEMGPAFLKRGIIITYETLRDFIETKKNPLSECLKSIRIDEQEIEYGEINRLKQFDKKAPVNIIVRTEK